MRPPQLLLGDVVRSAARRAPRRTAASLAGRELTFGEAADASERLAAVLFGRGVRRGARVVWWGETTLDAIPLYFALAHLGAALVPLNPRFSPDEAGPFIARADPALVVTDDHHAGDAILTELLAQRPPSVVDDQRVEEDDPHVVFFTSGTTGLPKGVVLSQRTERLRTRGAPWPVGPTVCMFPQFHMAGWSIISTWLSGDEVAFVERADAELLLQTVHRRRAHTLYAIPAVWRRLLDADRTAYDLSSLRIADTGTSATTPELLAAISDAFPGTTTSISYGSTEASLICMLWPEDVQRKPGSVGPPAPASSVRLDDEGELWVSNPYLFSGYFRDEEATTAALVDGWYRTGELAEMDDEGYYSIVGRTKDLIRTGGETVAPVEVDQVVQSHPAVIDAAVAGVPDKDWGEVITAFVVVRDGHTLDLPALRRHCEGRLAAHKHPRRLVAVDAIPRTGATGQVQRRLLVEIASAAAMTPSN
ncbi:MAG: class I adenylate-forming enzyme family protein [Acidimicrobiales bacterium]